MWRTQLREFLAWLNGVENQPASFEKNTVRSSIFSRIGMPFQMGASSVEKPLRKIIAFLSEMCRKLALYSIDIWSAFKRFLLSIVHAARRMQASTNKVVSILLKKMWLRPIGVCALLLLVGIASGKTVLVNISPPNDDRWQKAVNQTSVQQCMANASGPAQDFGRELDTLTGFYESVISVLLGLLALVAGLAFWTIKVVSKTQAEETAQNAAEKIMGSHDGFQKKLQEAVQKVVDSKLAEVYEKLEEAGVPASLEVTNPQGDVGEQPHPR